MTDKQNFEKDINVPRKKQIIIDGVDVSKCDWIWKSNYTSYDSRCFKNKDVYSQCAYCKEHPDCYFKQHARKTQECEELKKQLETSEEWRIKAEGLNEKLELKNTRYHKALEEIEKELKEDIYCESQECGCDDFEECLKCTKEHILDILNKAKGEKNERQ